MEKYDQNGIRFEMVEPLKQWKVFLTDFDKDSIIHSQLDKYGYKEVVMEITIKDNYPFMPPFVRIVEPRFSGYRGLYHHWRLPVRGHLDNYWLGTLV